MQFSARVDLLLRGLAKVDGSCFKNFGIGSCRADSGTERVVHNLVEVDGCGAENVDICRFGADSGTERAAQLVYDRDGRFTAARAGYDPPDE